MSPLLILLPVITIVSTIAIAYRRTVKKGKSAKSSLLINVGSFLFVMAVCIVMPLTVGAAGEETAAVAETASTGINAGLGYIAMALSTGLASLGAGIAVSGAASAAIGATVEDPKSFGKSLIFVALGEGVAIYGILISIIIFSKIG